MEQLKVRIYVDMTAAITGHRASYGEDVVTLSDTDMESLTRDDLDTLVSLERTKISHDSYASDTHVNTSIDSDCVCVSSPGIEGVKEALRLVREQRASRAAKADADRKKLIDDVIASSDSDLIDYSGDVITRFHGLDIPWSDPALSSRRESLDSYRSAREAEKVARLRAEIDSALAELRADPDLEPSRGVLMSAYGAHRPLMTSAEIEEVKNRIKSCKDAAEAKIQSAHDALAQWAREGHAGPDMQRAALGGYQVSSGVIESIEARLPDWDDLVVGSLSSFSVTERRSPDTRVLDLVDRLSQAVAIPLPPGMTLQVSRAMRLEIHDGPRTGAIVTMTCPGDLSDRYYIYYSDTPPADADSDDTDSDE